jgi:hypothetical protein
MDLPLRVHRGRPQCALFAPLPLETFMTRTQLHRAVASATGDTIRTIRALGFRIVDDRELTVECPTCGQTVPHPGFARDGKPAMAECLACDSYFNIDHKVGHLPQAAVV